MVSNIKVDPYKIDDDDQEWTEEDFKNARPGREVFAELSIKAPRGRGRPVAENPKVRVTMRLDTEVLDYFKKGGVKGWQTRLNAALRKIAHLN